MYEICPRSEQESNVDMEKSQSQESNGHGIGPFANHVCGAGSVRFFPLVFVTTNHEKERSSNTFKVNCIHGDRAS